MNKTACAPFSVICERKDKLTRGGLSKYERFSVQIDTNHGTYSVTMPTGATLDFDLQTQNKRRFDSIISQREIHEKIIADAGADIHLIIVGKSAL